MQPALLFQHCPRCGQSQPPPQPATTFRCAACGLHYFFNPTVAVAVFVRRPDGQALFIRRAKEPGLGRLAPPGGFIDIGERAETAAQREIREEVGLTLSDLQFLSSETNTYLYAGITYPVLDLFFTARTEDPRTHHAADEVTACLWLDPLQVNPADMAFDSMRNALTRWQALLKAPADPRPDHRPPSAP